MQTHEPPTLRWYQERDLRKVQAHWRTCQAVLRQLPTGGGKGTEAAYLTYYGTQSGKRVLFLVDRRVLVNDFSENRLKKHGVPHGVIMGDDKRHAPWLNTHVASIDTLYRRLDRLPKADLIIADEARATRAPKWQAVLNAYPKTTKILGFDATPIAPGGLGLGRSVGGIFDAIVQGPSVKELIAEGSLVPVTILRPNTPVDRSKLRKQGPDGFTHQSLVETCATKKMVGNTVEKYKLHMLGRKTVFFGVDQNHCRETANEFNAAGIRAGYVDADTPQSERDAIWAAFEHGDMMVICNYGITVYGWDMPCCDGVILGRAFGSEELVRQAIGRCGRPFPGKVDAVVLDQYDSCGPDNLDINFEDDIEWGLEGMLSKRGVRDSISMSTCPEGHHFKTGPRKCPICGIEMPKKIAEVVMVDGEFVEFRKEFNKAMTAEEWRDKVQGHKRFLQLQELYAAQISKNRKPNYATMAFRSMFGYFPPKDWMKLVIGEDASQMQMSE